MSFKLADLTAANFMSYETLSLSFVDSKGCYLIRSSNATGDGTEGSTSNGEGKSSILEAIAYALYGKTIRDTKHFIQRGKKWCEVRLTIESKVANERLEIYRAKNHPEHKTTLMVTLNGEPITDDLTNTKSQGVINTRLGDFSAFLFRSVSPEIANFMNLGPSVKVQTLLDYFGLDFEKMYRRAAEGYQKATGDLTNEKQAHDKITREMIELGARISASKEYEENIADTKKKLTARLASIQASKETLQLEIDEHTPSAELSKQITTATKEKEAAQHEKTMSQSTISTLETKIRQVTTNQTAGKITAAATLCGIELPPVEECSKDAIADLTTKLSSLTQQRDRLRANTGTEPMAVLNLVPQSILSPEIVPAYTKKATSLQEAKTTAQAGISGAEADKKNALRTVKKCIDAAQNPQCPTCLQPVDTTMLETLKTTAEQEVAVAEQTVRDCEQSIQQAEEKTRELISRFKNHVLKVMEEHVTELNAKKETLEAAFTAQQAAMVAKLREQISIALAGMESEKSALYEGITTFTEAIENATKRITDLTAEYRAVMQLENNKEGLKTQETMVMEQLQGLKSKADEIEKNIAHFAELEAKAKATEATVVKAQQTVDVWDTWKLQLGASGIRNLCLKDILAMLNERVNYYLGQLFRLREVRLHFVLTDSGNIDVETTGLEYGNASNGERKRINIGVVLAMSDIKSAGATNMGFRFFDEIMDSLDQAGTSAVLDIFSGLAAEQIFVVSHNPFFEREMLQRSAHLHIIQVRKEEAGSTATLAA